jgi:hypothetical protein
MARLAEDYDWQLEGFALLTLFDAGNYLSVIAGGGLKPGDAPLSLLGYFLCP